MKFLFQGQVQVVFHLTSCAKKLPGVHILNPSLPEGAALPVAGPRWRKLGTFLATSHPSGAWKLLLSLPEELPMLIIFL